MISYSIWILTKVTRPRIDEKFGNMYKICELFNYYFNFLSYFKIFLNFWVFMV